MNETYAKLFLDSSQETFAFLVIRSNQASGTPPLLSPVLNMDGMSGALMATLQP